MNTRRVVVTGLAAVTPVGNDLETSWKNLVAGRSGIGTITRFDTTGYTTRIAAEVKGFESDRYIPPKQARRMDYFTRYAVGCATMLMEHSGWVMQSEEEPETGVILGCGLGGLETIENFHKKLTDAGPRKVSPFSIPMLIANMAAGQVSMLTRAKGANLATTSACASGTHGIGYAFSDIKLGRNHVMICGGVESTIAPMAISGFNAMRALSCRNEEPERASRPFDRDRDGFVIGEGCGMLLLESLEHALDRGARIYAEVVGFGASADAFHMTAPDETGTGMALAMQKALREAGVAAEAVDHINAHGTSTALNDVCETRAIKQIFGKKARSIPISANKSMIGHLLGGAGGVESVFSVLTIDRGVIPGTINLENPDPECDLDYVAEGSRDIPVEYVLCNSFGFGGTNASLLFKRFER
ncbi:MAG: beta-ketoacyl-ACP synthase II [Desulfovibrionales bacterium]